MGPRYEFELWHRGTTKIGEIGRMCQDISYRLVRNGVDWLDFSIDLNAFEEYCAAIGEHPRNVIEPLVTDIKVKRNGEYLFGVFVVEAPADFNENGSIVRVSCDGYLNLLADRYVTPPSPILQVESTSIAWQLIDLTQNDPAPNADLGITLGTQYMTGINRDRRDYEDQNVKDGIINLTNLENGPFDFGFSPFRVFSTHEHLGSERTDVIVKWPATNDGTIPARRLRTTRSGSQLFNRIIGKGSGNGEETLRHVADNTSSQTSYFLKEKPMLWNGVSNQSTLEEHVEGEVQRTRSLLELPTFTVDGSQFDLGVVRLGDRIVVRQNRHIMYAMDGLYRIEELAVDLDENMAETIAVTVDNFGV